MIDCRYPFLDLAMVNAPYMEMMEDAVIRVVRSGRYVGGEECRRFEMQLASLCGSRCAVGVSNGLDALRLILRAMVIRGDLHVGDQVIVPANTYVASVLAITDAGLVPVLAEPSEQTLNLDTSRLEEYLTPRSRAVMPVHLYGRVCWDAGLKDFAERHGLIVIEDNAQAIGARALTDGFSGSRAAGALGHAGAFSFYPTKNIGALGDAGAVVTDDEDLASVVGALANYGSDRRYHNVFQGYNCRLDPVQAAVLNVKLPHVAEENDLRRTIAAVYDEMIDNRLIRKPVFSDDGTMVWHQYVVMTPQRERFRQYLQENGVQSDVHYAVPPHMQPCFAGLEHGRLPVTQMIANQVVSLPVTRCTSVSDARDIARIINSFK